MKKFLPYILPVLLLLSFAALSKFEDREVLRSLDFAVTVRVQDAVARFCTSHCDGLLEDVGFFASPLFSSIAVVGITIWLAYDRKMKQIRLQALLIPALFALLTLAEIYGKSIVGHPAPPFFMLKNPTTLFPKYTVIEQFSYPSGHAARAMFLALVASSFLPRFSWSKKIAALILFVGVISLGKIYLGQHWLSDVAGGLLLGSGFGLPVWLLTTPNKSPIMQKQ
jgi:membrane-associated phospholipid phosphatase